MAKVTGLGGVFLKADDPKALYAWYEKHLGIQKGPGGFAFPKDTVTADTVIAFFPKNTNYFGSDGQPAMLNLRVENLDAVLDGLEGAGVQVDPKRESYDFGRFGWFVDPEGNRVELWEPVE